MNKIRSFLANGSTNLSLNRNSATLPPELGFQLTLELPCSNDSSHHHQKNYNSSQLNVNLIAARHLPTLFGFKTVQGYVVKVKLFPGSTKYDSCIQANTWPKFNENFKFSLEPDRKSSIKTTPSKNAIDSRDGDIDKLFSGQFVVMTVYALLELPPGNFNRLNKTYRSLRDRSASIVSKISDQNSSNGSDKNTKSKDVASGKDKNKGRDKEKDKDKDKDVKDMTKTESRRNIGSVTCYLEPKIFKRNQKSVNQFVTEELWYPIKDLTVSPIKKEINTSSITSHLSSNSTKGQLELALELCYAESAGNISVTEAAPSRNSVNSSKNPTPPTPSSPTSSTKKPWLLDMKKKLSVRRSKSCKRDFFLQVTTTKFRCSIKVKDEFESIGSQLYIKTVIYDGDVPINSWKSNQFQPSLSLRWDPQNSTIAVPLPNLECLEGMRIKSTIATKSKIGKKIILGTVIISPNAADDYLEHWKNAISNRNEEIVMWHNFQ